MVDRESLTVLVTGGAGFVGARLIQRLMGETNHRVISLDTSSSSDGGRVLDGWSDRLSYKQAHTKHIFKYVTVRPDVIYHLGEYARVEQSLYEPEKVFDTSLGTFKVLEFWRACGARLIYSGSSTRFTENGEGHKLTPYTFMKDVHARLVERYNSWYGLDYAIAYLYNAYGPGESTEGEYATLIGIYEDCTRRGEPLPVRSPGTQMRNFTHVDDIVDGLIKLLHHRDDEDCQENRNYKFGSPDAYTVEQVARLFGGEICWLDPRDGNRQNVDENLSRGGIPRIQWQAKRTLPEYVRELLREIEEDV